MKRLVKGLLITFAVASTIMWSLWGYAAYVVWSGEVTVTVSDYTLTISDPPDGTVAETFTFDGTLNADGSHVSGKTVTLYVDDGGGYVSTGLTDTTDAMGAYSITWTPSSSGTYTFKVKADI